MNEHVDEFIAEFSLESLVWFKVITFWNVKCKSVPYVYSFTVFRLSSPSSFLVAESELFSSIVPLYHDVSVVEPLNTGQKHWNCEPFSFKLCMSGVLPQG